MPNLQFRINPNKEPDVYVKMYDGQVIPVSVIDVNEISTRMSAEVVNYFVWNSDTFQLSNSPYWYNVSDELTTNLYGGPGTCVQVFRYPSNSSYQMIRKVIGASGLESASGPSNNSLSQGTLILVKGTKDGVTYTGNDPDSLFLLGNCTIGTDFVMTSAWLGSVSMDNTYGIGSKFSSGAWSGVQILSADQIFPGPGSEAGGGTGDLDNSSDIIPIPSAPQVSATSSAFITIYNPTLSQLQELANYMWSTDFVTNVVKMFANPMDVILGLNILPIAIPNAGAVEVKVGGISTGVSMNKGTSQYVTLDCGSININEFWGSYLDYSPYTKIQIYLPYIGYKDLNPDEVMGKELDVIYYIDVISGACVAYVRSGDVVLYQFNGQCAQTIPINGSDFSSLIATVTTLVVGAGIAIATSGTAAPASGAMLGQATAGTAVSLSMPTSLTGVAALAGASVGAVMCSKPSFERSGSLTGVVGQLAIQNPYIIITRPRQSLPKNYKVYEGYPSNITSRLGDLSGFTQIERIRLENMSSTLIETNEIYKLLGEGVII